MLLPDTFSLFRAAIDEVVIETGDDINDSEMDELFEMLIYPVFYWGCADLHEVTSDVGSPPE